AAHVGFDGADVCPEAKPVQRFGGSIPLDKGCRPGVPLGWAMNGEPLTPVHGAPLRAVVPGYIGARSVKWLERIEVRAEASEGYYQATAYRLFDIPLGEVALNSDILSASAADGRVELEGYAFAGG